MSHLPLMQAVVPPSSMEYAVPVRLYGDGADAFSSGLMRSAAILQTINCDIRVKHFCGILGQQSFEILSLLPVLSPFTSSLDNRIVS